MGRGVNATRPGGLGGALGMDRAQRSGTPFSGRGGLGSGVRTGPGLSGCLPLQVPGPSHQGTAGALPAPTPRPRPREAPHVAHLADDGLLLLAQAFLTAVLEPPVQVLVHFQDLREQAPGPEVRPGSRGWGTKRPEGRVLILTFWSSSLPLVALQEGSHTPTSREAGQAGDASPGSREDRLGGTTLGQVASC